MNLTRPLIFGLIITSSHLALAGEIPCESVINRVLPRLGYAKLSEPTEYRFVQKSSGNNFNYNGLLEALASKTQIETAQENADDYCRSNINLRNGRWDDLNRVEQVNKPMVEKYHKLQAELKRLRAQLDTCTTNDDCATGVEYRLREDLNDKQHAFSELEPQVAQVRQIKADIEKAYDSKIAVYDEQCETFRKEAKRLGAVDFVVCRTPECVDATLRGEYPTTHNRIDNPVITFAVQKNDIWGSEIKIHTDAGDFIVNAKTCEFNPISCNDFIAAGVQTLGLCGTWEAVNDARKFVTGKVKKADDEGMR